MQTLLPPARSVPDATSQGQTSAGHLGLLLPGPRPAAPGQATLHTASAVRPGPWHTHREIGPLRPEKQLPCGMRHSPIMAALQKVTTGFQRTADRSQCAHPSPAVLSRLRLPSPCSWLPGARRTRRHNLQLSPSTRRAAGWRACPSERGSGNGPAPAIALCGPRARGPPPHIPAETGPGCKCRRPRGPGRGPAQAPARPAGQGTPSPHTPVRRQQRRQPRPGAAKSQSKQPGRRAAGRCGTGCRARPRPSPRETITVATLREKTPPRNQSCYDV